MPEFIFTERNISYIIHDARNKDEAKEFFQLIMAREYAFPARAELINRAIISSHMGYNIFANTLNFGSGD